MADAPPISSHPFMVRHKNGDRRYFRSIADAKAAMLRDLDAFQLTFQRLGDWAAVRRIDDIKQQVNRAATLFGGKVEGDVEPEYGAAGRYSAELVHRKDF